MIDAYTSIFGSREALTVPGETSMEFGPIEGSSIFGTNVVAADSDIPTEPAPSSGPVDMAPMPIEAVGPATVEPISDMVTYGSSVFGGPVRDVAGLGRYVAAPGNMSGLGRYVAAPANLRGFGEDVAPAAINFGLLSKIRVDPNYAASQQQQAATDATLPVVDDAAEKRKKMYMYGGIAVAALVVVGGLVWYSKKPA